MGVPKFYRWISERYPCLSEVVKEYQIPEFDNLYLDMNGIIHTCSHPNDDDIHFRISEEKIFADIFHYLEALFRLIRPQKVFFMAIDGVAPRAKMNQQRGRRFRSAKEAEDKEKEALRKGEVLPEEKRFDSNCITPGTEFMVNLQKQLDYFVRMKVSTDPLWQKTQVILSGHQVPGEGEHKIMEFIRYQKSKPDYNVDTRHCLYGLDADLMMLGLCSHEPYFSLLREEVKFGGKKNEKRVTTPEETTFHLLHLSLLREYLDLEFAALKPIIPFPYNLEHIIDDWVLMGFLVGNDFIPHLPHFHISKGALPLLYAAYMDVLPTMDGYINEGGQLNMGRFEKLMTRLAQIDYDHFNDIYADTKWLESRHGRKQLVPTVLDGTLPTNGRSSDTISFLLAKAAEVDDLLKEDSDNASYGTVEESETIGEIVDETEEDDDDETASDEDKQFQAEFKAHKRHYYIEKLEYSEVDGDVLRDQAEGYVRAIQWILHYYYTGVCSWSWFYPHHYAPYVSDIKNFSSLELTYDLGQPFLPYEQLLGVLPAASKDLLPTGLHSLMSSSNSPIIEFYPSNFETDKNGKQQEWEAVVLIPFIDEKRLISAIKDCEQFLSDKEKLRNQHGPMQVYVYDEKDSGDYHAPAYFPPVIHTHCRCEELPREVFVIKPSLVVKSLHPRFTNERYIPGFPSMRHLPYKGTLKKSSVCVFHMNTLNESQILALLEQPIPDIEDVARRYCGQTVFVNWPHLLEARVVAVANNEVKYSIEMNPEASSKSEQSLQKVSMSSRDADDWRSTDREIKNRYANRWGIDIGKTQILLYATPIIGRKFVCTQNGRITLEKQWSTIPVAYAIQATVKDIAVKDLHGSQFLTLAEVFPTDSVCFMLGEPGYGSQGRVLLPDKKSKGKVRLELENIHEPDIEELKKRWLSTTTYYVPGYVAAQRVGISPHLISRVTGTIFVYLTPVEDDKNSDRVRKPRKINVGLNLKFNKQNEEIPGWSRKTENGWQYSMKTVDVLKQYMQEFPDFFDFISRHNGSDDYSDVDVFGKEGGTARANLLNEFIQTLPCYKAERQPCGTAAIETDTLPLMLKHQPKQMKLKPMVMQVKPHLLYKPDLTTGSTPPDPSANYHLLDRVVNVRQGYSVPLGYRGTVIGIKNAQKVMDVVYEVLFDSEFSGGLPVRGVPSSPTRVYHLPSWAMINLTHGKRQQAERENLGKPVAIVHPSGNRQQSAEPARNQQRQSYKAAVEQAPAKPAVPQQQQQQQHQPKLLTRGRNDNPSSKPKPAAPGQAPSPSSLPAPTPFLAIWNSLVQQHEQQNAAPAEVVAPKTPLTPKAQNQRQPPKPKAGSVPINNASNGPSLQEAARILPKVAKPAAQRKMDAALPPSAPVLNPVAVFPAPPVLPLPVHNPVGTQISLEELFGAPVQPILLPPNPIQMSGPPPVNSFCIQLMDVMMRSGLGAPIYTYTALPDGTTLVEISELSSGVIGRYKGKNNPEAAELAAAQVLHNRGVFSVPVMVPEHAVVQPIAHPPGIHFGAMNRGPVPNSFVPLQVTRQSVHVQPKASPTPPRPAAESMAGTSPRPTIEALNPIVTESSAQAKLLTAKPPGSRLAIRFNGP